MTTEHGGWSCKVVDEHEDPGSVAVESLGDKSHDSRKTRALSAYELIYSLQHLEGKVA